MKPLYWNCGGLGRAAAVRSLSRAISRYSPDFVCVAKTKILDASVVLGWLGFDVSVVVSPEGKKGV